MYILNKDVMYISGAQLGDNGLKVVEMLQSILSNFKSVMGIYLIRMLCLNMLAIAILKWLRC